MEVINATHKLITELIKKIDRSSLPFNEYKFITDEQLKEYYFNRLTGFLDSIDSELLVALSDSQILGVISYTKNEFDSEMFGFDCYRIAELVVFRDSYKEVVEIVNNLIDSLETRLSSLSKKVHLTYSLNNNMPIMDRVFNALNIKGYYYIHTLITFSQDKNHSIPAKNSISKDLKIRDASYQDTSMVAELAKKSFRFSRFHFDPFLDNNIGDQLLKESAVNSIQKGYVDVMFIAEIEGKVVGYYSGKKHHLKEFGKNFGDAVISAVDSSYRGRGVFSSLDTYLLHWFSENTDFAEMGTYLINYPIHRTWIKKGLPLIRSLHQFSKMIQRQDIRPQIKE